MTFRRISLALTLALGAAVVGCGQASVRGNDQGGVGHADNVINTATTTLTNGVAVTNLSGASGSQTFFSLAVPAGATNLSFQISGGTGDADMYVKFGSQPTTSSYDCRPYISGNNETCTISNIQAGTYYVMLNGYAAYSGVTLVGSYSGGTTSSGSTTGSSGSTGTTGSTGSSSLQNGVAVTIAGATGSNTYYTVSIPSGASNLTIQISGGTGDADLYVKFGSQPTSSSYDCRPYVSGNNESCPFATPQVGTYYIMINGYAAYSGVSLVATWTASTTTGGSTTGSTGSTGTTGTSGGGLKRVLFDSAHKQIAGNACWIVDANAPAPSPSTPTSETSWDGAISHWAFDLFQSGRYSISELPNGTSLNWGGGGSGDLQNFDVFISDEPEAYFTSTEQSALMSFANAGKGIILISDHNGATRCSSGCTQATTVINDFLVSGAGTSWGIKSDNTNVGSGGLTGTVTSSALAGSFGNGPFGSGSQFNFHSGSTVSATGSNAQVVVNSSSGGMIAASTLSSGGRLVLVGDSSPEDDGTAAACSGASVQNGWGEVDDRVIMLNATAWVAHDGS